ncbi:MAG: glycosyltransferase family 2 protein [Lachnospiraceae bacterium]|nr:glycosyltransferase family 2 protein [Lachnospiraceae bacterium]
MKHKVAIGIPTTSSFDYIEATLEAVAAHIRPIASEYDIEIIIALNGGRKFYETKTKIINFKENNKDLSIHFIECVKQGKNNALNKILKYAENSDIIHFLDDDVILKEGTVKTNIKALIDSKREYRCPVLVGSNFYAYDCGYKYFRNLGYGIFTSLKRIFWYKLFSLPFEGESRQPKFCSGQSVCFFRKDFGYYPDDETGIADDGYIGNYFLIKNTAAKINLVKPKNSIVYFKIASVPSEWLRQQIRIFTGVYYSYKVFPGYSSLFEKEFSWKYSVSKNLRGKHAFESSFIDNIRLFILRSFQRRVLKKSMKLINNNNIADWAIASSSKAIPTLY